MGSLEDVVQQSVQVSAVADAWSPIDARQDLSGVRSPALHRSGHQGEDLGPRRTGAEIDHSVLDGGAGRGSRTASIADAAGLASEEPDVAADDVASLRHQDRHGPPSSTPAWAAASCQSASEGSRRECTPSVKGHDDDTTGAPVDLWMALAPVINL